MKRDYKNQTNNLDQVSSLSWPPLGSVFWALRHRCISLVHVIQHKLHSLKGLWPPMASRHRRGYRRTDPASGFEISANLISCLKLLENVGKMNQTDSTSTRCRVGVWDHQMHHDLTAYKAYKACRAHYLCLPSGSSTHPLCELSPSPAVHSLFCHGGKSAFEDLTPHTAHYGTRQALRQISGGVAAAAQSYINISHMIISWSKIANKFHVTKAPLKRPAFNAQNPMFSAKRSILCSCGAVLLASLSAANTMRWA